MRTLFVKSALKPISLLALISLPGFFPATADTLILKNGAVLRDVKIVGQTQASINYLETEGGSHKSVAKSQVRKISYSPVDWKRKELLRKKLELARRQAMLKKQAEQRRKLPGEILEQQIAKLNSLESKIFPQAPDSEAKGETVESSAQERPPENSDLDIVALGMEIASVRNQLSRARGLMQPETETEGQASVVRKQERELAVEEADHRFARERATDRAAIWRSMVFAGWGQYYKNEPVKATAFGVLFAGALIGAYSERVRFATYRARYDDIIPYLLFQPQGNTGLILGNFYYGDQAGGMARASNNSSALLGLAGFLWLSNIVDVVYFCDGARGGIQIVPDADGKTNVSFRVRIEW